MTEAIIPIFLLIGIGVIAKRTGLMPDAMLSPANRLIFTLAMPSMVFKAILSMEFKVADNAPVILVTLFCVLAIALISCLAGILLRLEPSRMGSFIQGSLQGNLGYVGLSVAYFALGQPGFGRSLILFGFVVIFHNILSIVALTYFQKSEKSFSAVFKAVSAVFHNPMILSVLAGLMCQAAGLELPTVFDRTLEMLGRTALPMALLIMGATFSYEKSHHAMPAVLAASLLKLGILPGIGLLAFRAMHITPGLYAPGLLFLACPTAAVTFVVSREMGGDPDLNLGIISVTTLLSAITIPFWMAMAS